MTEYSTRVLYIEDDEGLARLLGRRLKRHGYELESVTDGQSGLDRLAKADFDVVAIDYELPGMNGVTVLQRMQDLEAPPPAIMISGAGDMETAIAAMKEGAADYMIKTVDGSYMDLLPRTIERVLDNRRLKAEAEAAQQALEEEQRLAAAVFDASAKPMLIADGDGHIRRCNAAFEARLGYTNEETVGRDLNFLASEEHDRTFYDALWQAVATTGHWGGTLWVQDKAGALLAQEMTLSGIEDSAGRIVHYVAVYTDVTEQLHREQQARHEAHHDMLTGLANRSLLMDRISQAIELCKREDRGFALLFLDLDGFKPINDEYGHRAGDILLQETAQRLQSRCRGTDTVARYGGDEFVILLRDACQRHSVGTLAQEFIDQIGEPVLVDGIEHRVAASVGAAFYPDNGASATPLLKAADEAMYQAKESGKGCFRFYEGTGYDPA